jgi:hypothetical protein
LPRRCSKSNRRFLSLLSLTQIAAEVVADLPILSNCKLSQIAIQLVIPACQKTQIIGGNFQDAAGNVVARRQGRLRGVSRCSKLQRCTNLRRQNDLCHSGSEWQHAEQSRFFSLTATMAPD